ncbi:MAG: glycosyltransferase involved in cell wall biosynthesis [Parvicella sp.]|jgi:glycosyltransferase involved in cell wall biosynthesis
MRVLMMNSSSDFYGASKVFYDVASTLTQNDIQVYVVLSSDGILAEKLSLIGVKVQILRLGVIRRKYLNIGGLFNRLYFLLRSTIIMARLVKRENIQLVYANTTAVINGSLLKLFLRQTITHLWHVHEIVDNSIVFNRLISFLIIHGCDKCVGVSDAVVNHWSNQLAQSERKKFIRIYNGYHLKDFANSTLRTELDIPLNNIVLTMVGRISKIKGQDFFVEIALELLKIRDNITFIVVGDVYPGNEWMEDNLKKKIGSFSQSIKMLGFRKDIDNILEATDIFVLPSVMPDSLPTTILEAMAHRLPVVTTVTGGAGEMIKNGINGFHVDVWDVNGAVLKIEELIENDRIRIDFGEFSLAFLNEQFSYSKFQSEILSMFNDNFALYNIE